MEKANFFVDDLCFDAEWLAVLKNTNELMSTSYKSVLLPTKGLSEKWDYSVDEKQIEDASKLMWFYVRCWNATVRENTNEFVYSQIFFVSY